MNLIPKDGGFEGQFRVGKVARPRVVIMVPPGPTAEAVAQERAIRMQAAVSLLVRAKLAPAGLETLRHLAKARAQRDFAAVEAAARTMAAQAPEQAPAAGPVKFRDIVELWLSGVLHMQKPQAVEYKGDESVQNTRGLMNFILPLVIKDRQVAFGDLPVTEITADDCDAVKDAVFAIRKGSGDELGIGQIKKYCRAVRQVLEFAVEPLRLIKSVPVSEKWVPKGVETKKQFQMIYPSEDARLMRCGEVDIMVRFYCALLWRLGLRPSEAAHLRWRNHSTVEGVGRLNIEKVKAKRGVKARKGRAFHIDDDVHATFVALKPEGAQPDDQVFPLMTDAVLSDVVRAVLHPALRMAGLDVTRPTLFRNDDEYRHIVAHDGRATHVTLKGALGFTEAEIMRVTGHETSKEIKTYSREIGDLAQLVQRGQLEWFEPLDLLLGLRPEASSGAGGVARRVARVYDLPVKKAGTRSPARTSEPSFPQSETLVSREKSPSNGRNRGAVPPETGGVAQADGATTAGLTAAIASAAAAGKWTLVDRLTALLEGLQAAGRVG